MVRANVTEERARLEFDDASLIDVSLRPEDYVGPEVLEFSDSGNFWIA